MDDQSYFGLKDDITPGNVGFYKKSVPSAGDVPDEVRFRTKAKYPEKLDRKQVWQDCVKQRLVSFLGEHHADGDYFFWQIWSGLDSCHYANETQDFFIKLEIPFIPRGSNPFNSPQVRPIERFWEILKAKVNDGGWEAKTYQILKTDGNG